MLPCRNIAKHPMKRSMFTAMSHVMVRKAGYDDKALESIVSEIIDTLIPGRISKGARVMIKPNLLLPAKPDKAIITHPLIVKAAAEYVIDCGASVTIQDSPAMGTFDRVLKEGGYREVFDGLDVTFAPFETSVKKDIGSPFGAIDIARDAVEADLVINIAKLKTHSQMLLTLGVKNLFGCIIGYRKPEWHFRSGVDRKMFAGLLVQIYRMIQPELTLIDGILAMEGQGPGRSGVPRNIGVLLASRNAAAADLAVCRMLGIDPEHLPTHTAASAMALVEETISIDGDLPRVDGFNQPVLAPLTFGPKRFQGLMRKHLLQRPVVNQKLCKRCGECWQYCPAKAIDPGAETIQFNYADCIRCYCCIEVCPHGALRAKETLPGKLIRKLPLFNR
jgi:uncharacterized protein (DUF362 family)/Pyruvate/2-oxoacid:ferredoxin oxidoreductase delta subunit